MSDQPITLIIAIALWGCFILSFGRDRSRVAFYYWPSALIREYIAIHAEKKHAISFFLGWIIMVAVTIWIIL